MVKVAVAQILYKPCFMSGSIDYMIEPFGSNETSISSLSFTGDTKFFQKYRTAYISWLKTKIIGIIEYCIEKHVDILAFPEYSIPEELLADIQNSVKPPLVVVAGTHIVTTKAANLPSNYPKQKDLVNSAICPVITCNGVLGYSVKQRASKWENGLSIPAEEPRTKIHTDKCDIAIEICIEALASGHPVDDDRCIIIVPSYSPSTEPFYYTAELARYCEVPTLYVNAGSIGGSTIYAAFSKHCVCAFEENGRSIVIPKNEECIIIANLNLDEMHAVSGTIKHHSGAEIDSVVNLYYRKDTNDQNTISYIKNIISQGLNCKYPLDMLSKTDSITAKKLTWLNKRYDMGILTESEIQSTLRFISLNQESYDTFITAQANEMLNSLFANYNNVLRDPASLKNISVLSSKLDNSNNASVSSEDRFSNDANLFTGRSVEISKISSFFDSSTPVLICQGLRGIGKSKLVQLIKPKVIPDNNIYTLYHISLTAGSGYDFLVDELFYNAGSPISEPSRKPPEDAARLFLACLARSNKTCFIIDDYHYLLNRDKSYCDSRTDVFLSEVFSKVNGSNNKFILTTNIRIFLVNSDNIFMSRLSDEEISWIVRYCCQAESKTVSNVSSEILNAIHGNPLAAVIVAQLLLENKSVPLPEEKDTFKRFEEQFIANLIGELSLSSDEESALQVLSVSESAVELDFIKEKYPYLIPSVTALMESFLVESTPQEGTVDLHPLIKDFFRKQIDVGTAANIHNDYADFIEHYHGQAIDNGIPDPLIISRMVYHYAGGLDISKLKSFKGKYIEQLNPVADRLFKQRKYEEAAEYYYTIYKTMGDARPDVLLRLAQCYVYTDNLSEAEKYVELAIAKKPRGAYIYAKYAIALAFKYENAAQAESYAFRAEEIYRENGNTLKWELAEIYFAQAHAIRWSDKKRAIKLYKQACEMEPSNCYYLCTLCRRLLSDGYVEDAHKYFLKSLEVNPDYKAHSQLAEEFKSISFGDNTVSEEDLDYDEQIENDYE